MVYILLESFFIIIVGHWQCLCWLNLSAGDNSAYEHNTQQSFSLILLPRGMSLFGRTFLITLYNVATLPLGFVETVPDGWGMLSERLENWGKSWRCGSKRFLAGLGTVALPVLELPDVSRGWPKSRAAQIKLLELFICLLVLLALQFSVLPTCLLWNFDFVCVSQSFITKRLFCSKCSQGGTWEDNFNNEEKVRDASYWGQTFLLSS